MFELELAYAEIMPHAAQTITIHASVDAIWRVISDFSASAKYLAMVTNCSVQGSGIGALRTLTYLDGSVIVERLEMVDEATHGLSYTLLSDTAFGSCLTTMALRDLSLDQTNLIWTADFHPSILPVNEVQPLMQSLLAANCQALKQFLEHQT